MFHNVYAGKKVLITGHTGFKGTWLTIWLLKLGANIVGISRDIPTKPSMFEILNISGRITHYSEDIRNTAEIIEIISHESPDFIFHLAAQSIVSVSYSDPIETISTNTLGTANILEALRLSCNPCTVILITSDKAYDNVEQIWGYKENDKLGGNDIYSGSKGAAELVINSYYKSFFNTPDTKVRIAVARAGNVIGGGDWACDRIVVDCMRAWSQGHEVTIRSPNATRPWQHVLEPLSGYLWLGAELCNNKSIHGQAFNFGPRAEQNKSVIQLIEELSLVWNFEDISRAFRITDNIPFHEASLLKLNCEKSAFYLKWQATLSYHETARITSEWYYAHYKSERDMYKLTTSQIESYMKKASEVRMPWTE